MLRNDLWTELEGSLEIKTFFQHYLAQDRVSLIKSMLQTIIHMINTSFATTPKIPVLQDFLQSLILNFQTLVSLESIQSRLASIKSSISRFESSSPKMLSQTLTHPFNCSKAPSCWRQGDTSVFRTKRGTLEIYPDWWMSFQESGQPEHFTTAKSFPKTTPRILYPKALKKSQNFFKNAQKSFADKSVEANFESLNSMNSENRVRFDEKNIETSRNSQKESVYADLYSNDISRSHSSGSQYFPSPEMKRFYQVEFKRIFGDSFN